MRLIYVLPYYFRNVPTHFEHILNLVSEIARSGVDVQLVVERGDAPEGVENSARVHVLKPTGPVRRRLALFVLVRRLARDPGKVAAFVRISAPTALTVKAACGRRSRVVLWNSATNFQHDRERPMGLVKLSWFLRSRLWQIIAFRVVDAVATGPEPMIDYYARHGVSRAKLRLLYNDIDVRRFLTSPERRAEEKKYLSDALGIDEKSRVLLFVHRMSPAKRAMDYLPGLFSAMRQAELFEDWQVILIGGGPELPLLKEWLTEFGEPRIHALGDVANVEIQRYYAAADIFIQASRNEGFPRVIIEAMAAGLPISTTDAGGTRALLGKAQQTYVSEASSPADFVERTVKLMRESDSCRAALTSENLLTVQRFDTPQVARMYRDLLFGVW